MGNLPVGWDNAAMPRRKRWAADMVTCHRCYDAGLLVTQTIASCEECQRRKVLKSEGRLPSRQAVQFAARRHAEKRAAQSKKASGKRYKAA